MAKEFEMHSNIFTNFEERKKIWYFFYFTINHGKRVTKKKTIQRRFSYETHLIFLRPQLQSSSS